MRRTWPPTAAGSHYSPTQENVQLGGAEKEQDERHSCTTAYAVYMRKETKKEEREEEFSDTEKDLDCSE